jgi:hypothetical protein
VFGSILSVAAGAIYVFHYEVAFLPLSRAVRLRHGFNRAFTERTVRFDQVRAVRLTLDDGARPHDAVIELLCPLEDIACPPTRIPRQEALYLAMMIGVPLLKVSSTDEALKGDVYVSITEDGPMSRGA